MKPAGKKLGRKLLKAQFLNIFGVDRKKAALFEHEVRFENKAWGFIDLFWKGHIIIETKTPGKDLDKAYEDKFINNIPRVSSERRKYISIGFLEKNVIAGDSTPVIPNATLYEFGVNIFNAHGLGALCM